jgi:hypothetical protein
MGKIIAITNLTLDGVMQAPGHPDEDPRGGFTHGGWAAPYAAMQQPEAGAAFANLGALLFGRVTYEGFRRLLAQANRQPVHGLSQQHSQVCRLNHAGGTAAVEQFYAYPKRSGPDTDKIKGGKRAKPRCLWQRRACAIVVAVESGGGAYAADSSVGAGHRTTPFCGRWNAEQFQAV